MGRGGIGAVIGIALIGCAASGPRSPARSDSLSDVVDAINARLPTGSPLWRASGATTGLGRRFEAYRLGTKGLRLVLIPSSERAAAVHVHTWIRYQRRGDPLGQPELPEAAVDALRRLIRAHPVALPARVGLDRTRIAVRSGGAAARWQAHLLAHADWLCRPRWKNDALSSALAVARPEGWRAIADRLGRAAWNARAAQADASPPRLATVDDLRRALSRWWTANDAVVVVAGPSDRRSILLAAAQAFAACPDADRPPPAATLASAGGSRLSVRGDGPNPHLLLTWMVRRRAPDDEAALTGLVEAFSDPRTSPLAGLFPTPAIAMAVRHRGHAAGADVELFMTLQPTANASVAVARTTAALRRFVEGPDETVRARTVVRNDTLRRLHALDGAAAVAAEHLLQEQPLGSLRRRLEKLINLDAAAMKAAAAALLDQRPLVVAAEPRSRP